MVLRDQMGEMWSSMKESKTQHFMINDNKLMDVEQRIEVTETISKKLTRGCIFWTQKTRGCNKRGRERKLRSTKNTLYYSKCQLQQQ